MSIFMLKSIYKYSFLNTATLNQDCVGKKEAPMHFYSTCKAPVHVGNYGDCISQNPSVRPTLNKFWSINLAPIKAILCSLSWDLKFKNIIA